MARLRTFIAVGLDKGIREHLAALQRSLARGAGDVKWVEPENLHVTLLFLGEVDDRQIPQVCARVTEVAAKLRPFTMSVETVGCFPNPHRPRILWAGVGRGADRLTELHDGLEVSFQDVGYRREERRYQPHITLGRAKADRRPAQLGSTLAQQTGWQGGEMQVCEVDVMSSELTPKGPAYTVLGRSRVGDAVN